MIINGYRDEMDKEHILINELESKNIHQMFEEVVCKNPNEIAIKFNKEQLTYLELNEQANQLARVLVKKSMLKNEIIAIMMDKSTEMIIAILAVLKAGGAYLPIDIEYPEERIKYMISDSGVSKIIIQKDLLYKWELDADKILVNSPEMFNESKDNLELECSVNDLAYIIYTSGTTGLPKGTMIEHIGINNLKSFWDENFEITTKDRIAQFASISFDASVWEIFMTLLSGAALHLIPKFIINDFVSYQNYVRINQITIVTLPPTYAIHLEPKLLPSIRIMITAGSATSNKLVNKWCASSVYVNAYGPTEATICSTFWIAPSSGVNTDIIPIGIPINNTELYIVNENDELVSGDEVGELCIGSIGLARGYLNQPTLTSKKFIENPFKQGEKIYRTGDLARYLPDGNIEFRGRIDHQVKIRGHRVELNEIEAILLKHSDIKEIVVAVDKNEDDYLYAYYVSTTNNNIENLRDYMEGYLPQYMIPSYIEKIDKIPLTINGKPDLKALPKPNKACLKKEKYEKPRNEIENILVKLWKEVLNIDSIGISDNFYELGGDSIKAIQVAAKLHDYHLKLDIRDILKNPTIKELSQKVLKVKNESEQGIIEGEIPLSPIQRWFFGQQFTDRHNWNQSIMLYNQNGYEEDSLKKVFDSVLKQHDALRMVYKFEHSRVVQTNRGIEEKLLNFHNFELPKYNRESFIEREIKKIQGSMNLEEGPLVQVGLFKTESGDHLFISIHHLVMDAISFRILIEDIVKAYEQITRNQEIKLPLKTDSFMKWSNKLAEYAKSKELLSELSYWKELERNFDGLSLPKDGFVYENNQLNKASVTIELSREHTEQLLKEVNKAFNTEINDILLTSVGLTFNECFNCKQVLLNLESHGREEFLNDINISRTVGWFTSQCPVVLNISNSEDMSKQIKHIKEGLRNIPNKGIGYEVLKYLTPNELKTELTFSLNPEINFNYLGQFDGDINTEMFKQSCYSNNSSLGPDGLGNLGENNEIYFPINITGYIQSGQLIITISYINRQYTKSTMASLADKLKANIIDIIKYCINKDEVEYTPSDFSSSKLEVDEINKVFQILNKFNVK